MKKVILSFVFAAFACGTAIASDGGVYTETESYTNHYSYNFDAVTYEPVAVRPAPSRTIVGHRVASSADLARPCMREVAAKPIRIKTHTEIIDHYQVYQPVTIYQPVGTYTERRIVATPRCNRCNG